MIPPCQGMRVLVDTLVTTAPSMANVLIIVLAFFVVYGILGMVLFGGQLAGRCHQTFIGVNGTWTAPPAPVLLDLDHVCTNVTQVGAPSSSVPP